MFPSFHHIQSTFQSPFPHFIQHFIYFIHHKAIVLAFASSAGWQREAKRSSLQPSPRAAETQGRDKKMGENVVLFWDKNQGDAGEKHGQNGENVGHVGENWRTIVILLGKLSCNHGYLMIFLSWFVKKNHNKQELHVFEQTNGMCSPFHYNVDLQMIAMYSVMTQKRTTMFGQNWSYQPANPSRQAALPNRE